ncbi:MAG TPA: PilN domain-containing protein [Mycobacteriales bacterium]|nr:PilN domain-containing protein [Mycobacteriales bacterium]
MASHTTTTTTTTVARVNLLPPEIAEAQRARKIQAGLAAAVIGAVAVVGVLYLVEASKLKDAESDLVVAQQRGAALQTERAQLQSVADTYAAVAAKEALLRSALTQDVAWSGYLNDLMLTIPDNVWLTSMAATVGGAGSVLPGSPPAIGTVTFAGMAFDHDDVATWLEVLSRQKGFSNAYFTSSSKSSIGTRDLYGFASSVTLNEAALSNRIQRLLGS